MATIGNPAWRFLNLREMLEATGIESAVRRARSAG